MFMLHLPREMAHNIIRPALCVLEELRWLQTLTPEKPCEKGKVQKRKLLNQEQI